MVSHANKYNPCLAHSLPGCQSCFHAISSNWHLLLTNISCIQPLLLNLQHPIKRERSLNSGQSCPSQTKQNQIWRQNNLLKLTPVSGYSSIINSAKTCNRVSFSLSWFCCLSICHYYQIWLQRKKMGEVVEVIDKKKGVRDWLDSSIEKKAGEVSEFSNFFLHWYCYWVQKWDLQQTPLYSLLWKKEKNTSYWKMRTWFDCLLQDPWLDSFLFPFSSLVSRDTRVPSTRSSCSLWLPI